MVRRRGKCVRKASIFGQGKGRHCVTGAGTLQHQRQQPDSPHLPFEGEDFVYDGLITQRSPKRELTIGTPLPIIVASAYVATGKVDFVPDKEKLDI